MYRSLKLLIALAMSLALLNACVKPQVPEPIPVEPEVLEKSNPDNPVMTIELQSGENIEVELLPEVAPNTVNSIISLVQSGYYDGLFFDYIVADMIVIGGNSPDGGPGYRIQGEFSLGGYENPVSHTRGTVSLFNGGHPDSGAAQFFFVLDDAPHLDGFYAPFGRVLSGIEHIVRISRGPATEDGWATNPVETMKKVTVDTLNKNYEAPVTAEVWNEEQQNPVVTLEIEAGGTVRIELLPGVALNTVRNFVALVERGFYDGLRFHRIIPGFMVQGGDPQGNGTGGPNHYIYGEFASNGIPNNLPHIRGTISMARSQHNDSAGSQFFLVVGDASFLDGKYAGFGRVLEGMDVVDRIVNGPSDQARNGLALAPFEVIKRATVETFGVDIGAPKLILP
ncbi:MAG TPA: peptidylprolyl isomerase [Bacillota bacterium]|nr:peptidylprolyl isomerase [Bacillota bacterium]